MDEKIIAAAIGSLATVVATWLTLTSKERQRRSRESEAASLQWLEAQSVVLARLKALAKGVTREPRSRAEMERLLHMFAELGDRLKDLIDARNKTFIYISGWWKSRALTKHTERLRLLVSALESIVSHHRLHLSYPALFKTMTEIRRESRRMLEVAGSDAEIVEKSHYIIKNVDSMEFDTRQHLKKCTATLLQDARRLELRIDRAEASSARVCRIVGKH